MEIYFRNSLYKKFVCFSSVADNHFRKFHILFIFFWWWMEEVAQQPDEEMCAIKRKKHEAQKH